MGDWQADETSTPANCESTWCTALLWIVPAQLAGTYSTAQGEVTLRQRYQMLSGTLRAEGRTAPIEDGRVRGEEIAFEAGGKSYRGRLKGATLELNEGS